MADLHRLRFEYGKDHRLAFLGHLEVISTVERCIRRARLPFSIGNGFARRMRIQFTQALPVGASSACEYFDLKVTERLDPADALRMLAASTPKGLAPKRCGYIDEPQAALEAWLTRAHWEVEVAGVDPAVLEEAIRSVAERGSITYLRGEKEKTVDVTSTLVACEVGEKGAGVASVSLDTRSSNDGALRPGVLINAAVEQAGLAPYESLRVRRVGQWHEEDGLLVEPL